MEGICPSLQQHLHQENTIHGEQPHHTPFSLHVPYAHVPFSAYLVYQRMHSRHRLIAGLQDMVFPTVSTTSVCVVAPVRTSIVVYGLVPVGYLVVHSKRSNCMQPGLKPSRPPSRRGRYAFLLERHAHHRFPPCNSISSTDLHTVKKINSINLSSIQHDVIQHPTISVMERPLLWACPEDVRPPQACSHRPC